jgi:hypothetical protein
MPSPRNTKPTFEKANIDMSLTTAGLLPEKGRKLVKIYSEEKDWDKTKKKWHELRAGKRGSRNSSQTIFGYLKSRLKSGEKVLPSVENLHSILEECDSDEEKAQILYLYLIEDDNLVKYVISKIMEKSSSEEFDFSTENIRAILKDIEYQNGQKLDYSDSTLDKWIRNFRSLMRDIGVIKSKQKVVGQSPSLGNQSLEVSAFYSYNLESDNWLGDPTGWKRLFQTSNYWESLIKRLAESKSWQLSEPRGERTLKPKDSLFN